MMEMVFMVVYKNPVSKMHTGTSVYLCKLSKKLSIHTHAKCLAGDTSLCAQLAQYKQLVKYHDPFRQLNHLHPFQHITQPLILLSL